MRKKMEEHMSTIEEYAVFKLIDDVNVLIIAAGNDWI